MLPLQGDNYDGLASGDVSAVADEETYLQTFQQGQTQGVQTQIIQCVHLFYRSRIRTEVKASHQHMAI